MKTIMCITLAALLALQVYDFWSTVKIIRGGGHEINRLLSKLMDAIGLIPALIIIKGGISAGAIWFFWLIWAQHPQMAWFGALLFGAVSATYCFKFRKTNFKYDGL